MKSFKNLKIIDLSTVLAGPSVGTFFAELGSNVVKIEHPVHGDVTNTWRLNSETDNTQNSAYYASVNFAKKVLKKDLTNKEDFEKVFAMIQHADILISNFKKGDVEKFGLTDEKLKDINSRLIHGKITGFGADSDRVAYDLILQAETGFMSMNGESAGLPTKMPVALIDILAAHQLKEGILLALLERATTGKGGTVSVSLFNAAISSLANQASNYLMENHIPQRIGSLHPNIAPYGELFTTLDGAIITFAIGSDLHFSKLCNYLELNELTLDIRFHTNQQRVKNRLDLKELIQQKVGKLESQTIIAAMIKQFVPIGKIKNLEEVFKQEKALNLIRTETIGQKETKRITSIAFEYVSN